jgi:hypothetical protein
MDNNKEPVDWYREGFKAAIANLCELRLKMKGDEENFSTKANALDNAIIHLNQIRDKI